ncbi:MAG TPA: ParB/RepB/Spo0J family partition protein [Gemmataceae bacterium]|nr:ParB/RepB/Spo0J family partition protein [Gemmataceae bacterium]
MEKKSRLGRGLDALFTGTDGETPPTNRASQVSVDVIEQSPFQPRKGFDDDELSALSASIKTHGILQPLVVRQVGDRFQLVAGERRLRAARAAGLASVPVTVVNFNDQQALEAALIENIQRADLNPIEKAQGFKDYLDRYQMTHEQLAARLGLARPTITNLVALLELPPELQDAVRVGQLTTGHAKVLKGIPDPARQVQMGKEIIARGLSVHATEAFVKQLAAERQAAESNGHGAGEGDGKPAVEKTNHVAAIEDELRKKLGVRLEIKVKGKDRGQIVLTFESNDDFERMVEVLRR